MKRLTIVFSFAASLFSCNKDLSYKLATHQEGTRLPEIGRHLARLLQNEKGWAVEVLAGCRSLRNPLLAHTRAENFQSADDVACKVWELIRRFE